MNNSGATGRQGTRKKLVLVGGGHAQVFVLRAFAITPHPDVDLILITKDVNAPYSGMLPGFVAGHYTFEECHIDLQHLAALAGATLIHAPAISIDPKRREVQVLGHTSITYDVLSINVGITPSVSNIGGAADHALIVKPVSTFAAKWQALEIQLKNNSTSPEIVVVGGGAAGFELSFAAQYRLQSLSKDANQKKTGPNVTLVAGDTLLSQQNPRAKRLAFRALAKAGIRLIENDPVKSIDDNRIDLASGRTLQADATLVATGAAAPAWLSKCQLPVTEDGFLKTSATLQVVGHPEIFAVGDCATNIDHPRSKSGVFAVRQGPPLAENLRLIVDGKAAKPFEPQTVFLTLLSLGRTSAIASRGRFAAQGHWAWKWKDWIDRKFMTKFNDLEL